MLCLSGFELYSRWVPLLYALQPGRVGGGGGVLELIFAGYVPLALQSPYPIIFYFLAIHRPHRSYFWANM